MKQTFDLVGAMIAYEQGDASTEQTVELFAHLIQTGHAWTLQGHYGRAAAGLIERGLISKEGIPDWDAISDLD